MSLTELSIKRAEDIIKLYSDLLANRKGKLRLSQLQGYTINDISNSLKLMTAYRVYRGMEKTEKLKKYAEEDNSAIMHFHLVFFDEQFEKANTVVDGKVDISDIDSIKATYHDETVDSFLEYCLAEGKDHKDYWELIYSRIGIRYDLQDAYLQDYFRGTTYDQETKTALLTCLTHINSGKKWLTKKDYEKAYDEFNRAIQFYKFNADAYYGKGYIEFLCKEDSHAINSLTKAIELDTSHSRAYYYRGTLYLDSNSADQGISDLKKAEMLGIKEARDVLNKYGVK